MAAWDSNNFENEEFDRILNLLSDRVPELTKEFFRSITKSLSDTTSLESFSDAVAKSTKIQFDAYIKSGFSREEALQLLRPGFNQFLNK